MKKIKTLAWFNFIFFTIACAIANLSQLKIFNGQTNADVSNRYPTAFTPAGFTFAIWGVIYLSLFGFTIYHLIKAYREGEQSEANQALSKIGNLFIINDVATTFWVFAFDYEYLLLSVILILIQLITLLLIFIRLQLFDRDKSFKNKLFTQFPLSIYFAWLCVANVANISLYLVSIGWDGVPLSGNIWAAALIIVVFLLALFIVLKKHNVFFGLVVLWAVYGILKNHMGLGAPWDMTSSVCSFVLGALGIAVLGKVFKSFT